MIKKIFTFIFISISCSTLLAMDNTYYYYNNFTSEEYKIQAIIEQLEKSKKYEQKVKSDAISDCKKIINHPQTSTKNISKILTSLSTERSKVLKIRNTILPGLLPTLSRSESNTNLIDEIITTKPFRKTIINTALNTYNQLEKNIKKLKQSIDTKIKITTEHDYYIPRKIDNWCNIPVKLWFEKHQTIVTIFEEIGVQSKYIEKYIENQKEELLKAKKIILKDLKKALGKYKTALNTVSYKYDYYIGKINSLLSKYN